MPPPPPPRPPKKKANPWLILGIIAAVLIIGAAASNGTKSSPSNSTTQTIVDTTPTDTPTDTPVPTATLDASIPTSTPAPTQPPAKWTTTHIFSGTGDKTTATFDTSGDWKLVWTAQASSCCEAFFGASVYGSDRSFVDSGTDATIPAGKKGTDSTEEHTGAGSFYLKVYAGVPWTIQIQEFK